MYCSFSDSRFRHRIFTSNASIRFGASRLNTSFGLFHEYLLRFLFFIELISLLSPAFLEERETPPVTLVRPMRIIL